MKPGCDYQRIEHLKAGRAIERHKNLALVEYMGGEEVGTRVYAACTENYMDAAAAERNPRSRGADESEPVTFDPSKVTFDAEDTREKLEADVRGHFWRNDWCRREMVMGWLDRQAAITEREREGEKRVLQAMYDAANSRYCAVCNREEMLRDANKSEWRIDELQAERDKWRDLCGRLLDAAQEMQRVASFVDAGERG